jgi:Brp/Blh family beta-carotene 15,15'-monooxygenase
MLLFSLLFYLHEPETNSIIYEISQFKLPNYFLFWLLIVSAVLSAILLLINYQQLKSQFAFQSTALFSILILFTQTSLLWSFAVYFVFWHSFPSLKEQSYILYPNSLKPISKYTKTALPYWILSTVGLALAFYFFADHSFSLLSVFFAFIAAITIPHVVVIFFMHNKYNA